MVSSHSPLVQVQWVGWLRNYGWTKPPAGGDRTQGSARKLLWNSKGKVEEVKEVGAGGEQWVKVTFDKEKEADWVPAVCLITNEMWMRQCTKFEAIASEYLLRCGSDKYKMLFIGEAGDGQWDLSP